MTDDRRHPPVQLTREEVAKFLAERRHYGTDGDHPDQVIDGDGQDICRVLPSFRERLPVEEMGPLIAFVLEDYATAFGGKA